jgi:hypothetical protein
MLSYNSNCEQRTDTHTHVYVYSHTRYNRLLHWPLLLQDPLALVKLLEDTDPFGVYQEAEPGGLWDGSAGALLEKTGVAFTCPSKAERLSEPDLRNHTAEALFKQGGEAFLYFQHIRKVSGLCSLIVYVSDSMPLVCSAVAFSSI